MGLLSVHGVAIPTIDGIRNVLDHIGAKMKKVLWHNLREEPVVYINGRPFVLRDVERPSSNLEYTYKWNALPVEQRDGIRNYISDLIVKLSSNDVSFRQERLYVNKLNIVLIQVVKHEWPTRWQSFIPDLVSAAKSSESICENCMSILKLLSEEVFDFSRGEMTQLKINDLKKSLNRLIQSGIDDGARAVLDGRNIEIGRPVVFSLAAEGEAGVRKVLQMLREEFELTMALSGCKSIKEITRNHIVAPWDTHCTAAKL